MLTLNLALLFVFGLASIKLSFINREDLLHGAAEFGGRLLDLMNRSRHNATVSFHDLERNAYNDQPPTAAIIKFSNNNLPQSIV
jgi:hypothetical protein